MTESTNEVLIMIGNNHSQVVEVCESFTPTMYLKGLVAKGHKQSLYIKAGLNCKDTDDETVLSDLSFLDDYKKESLNVGVKNTQSLIRALEGIIKNVESGSISIEHCSRLHYAPSKGGLQEDEMFLIARSMRQYPSVAAKVVAALTVKKKTWTRGSDQSTKALIEGAVLKLRAIKVGIVTFDKFEEYIDTLGSDEITANCKKSLIQINGKNEEKSRGIKTTRYDSFVKANRGLTLVE